MDIFGRFPFSFSKFCPMCRFPMIKVVIWDKDKSILKDSCVKSSCKNNLEIHFTYTGTE